MIYPNDKSTVFSIVPFAINEFKPGLYPGQFSIPACLNDSKPERLVIGASEHMMAVGGRKQPIRIETPSYAIAKAIVDDFLEGQLFSTPNAHPGICWVQGDVPVDQFMKELPEKYLAMKVIQKQWFLLVIKKTEDDWKKYHNSRVVTDYARFAVRAIGIETPEWMITDTVGEMFNKCPACSTMNDPLNAICTGCHCVLDAEKYKKLQFANMFASK
jgi:hypothetical protein